MNWENLFRTYILGLLKMHWDIKFCNIKIITYIIKKNNLICTFFVVFYLTMFYITWSCMKYPLAQ